MPRGRPKKTEEVAKLPPASTKPIDFGQKERLLIEVIKDVAVLKNEVERINKRLDDTRTPQTSPVLEEVQPTIVEEAKFPVPPEYREIVDSKLNKSFEIKIIPRADSPLFEFGIVVPEKYSSLTPEEKKMNAEDLRSRILSYADGPNGVRQWVERVYENFNPEIKAQIVADRL